MATPNIAKNGLTAIPKILTDGRLATAAAQTVYTVPANKAAVIKHGTITNVTAAAAKLTGGIIPAGGTVDGTHEFMHQLSIVAGETVSLADYLGQAMLGAGDAITFTPDTAATFDVIISGVELS